jgi:uncharacterized membrane protein (DUF106 family)
MMPARSRIGLRVAQAALGGFSLLVLVDPGTRSATTAMLAPTLAAAIGFGGTMPALTFLLGALMCAVVTAGVREFVVDWVEVARAQRARVWLARCAREAARANDEETSRALRAVATSLSASRDGSPLAPLRPAALTLWFTVSVFAWGGSLVAGPVLPAVISLPWAAQLPLSTGIGFIQVWTLVFGLIAFPPSLLLRKAARLMAARRALLAVDRARRSVAA